jgi:prepilin-type N-terminal cleavage/methylation domain-containing protein
MHRPISDQSSGGKGGKGGRGSFRQGRSFEAPIGGFPKQVANTDGGKADGAAGGDGAPKQRKFKERKKGFTLLELLIVIGIIVIVASLVLAVSSSVVRASEERATRNTLEVLNMAAEEYERTVDRRITFRSGPVTGGIGADNPPPGEVWRWDVWSAQTSTTVQQERPPAASGVGQWSGLANPYNAVTAGLPAYSTLPFRRTAQLIWILTESPTCASIMQKLPDSIFRGIKPNANTAAFSTVRHCIDAWDTPIIAVFPGREATAAEVATNNPSIVDPDGTVKCDSEWGNATSQGGMQVSCKDRRILFISAGNDSRFTVQSGSVYTPSNDNLYSYQP